MLALGVFFVFELIGIHRHPAKLTRRNGKEEEEEGILLRTDVP